jgi:hypothetical protein
MDAKRYYTMRRSFLIALFIVIYNLAPAQLTYQTLHVEYDSIWVFKNLKIIPIRYKGPGNGVARQTPEIVSLNQALQQGLVTVSERGSASTENVHFLRINNKSNKSVFLGAGEIILGGRQDRMVSRDTILSPSEKDQYIQVMCVEEGRWSEKEKKFVYSGYANPSLRKVVGQSNNQVLVWKEVLNQLDFNGVRSSTLAYAARRNDKKYKPQELEYVQYFQNKFKNTDSTITGFVCMSGDKVIGCDVFATPYLFYGSLQALLYGYIEAASNYGKPVAIKDEKIKAYLDPILTSETSQEDYLKKNGKMYKYKGKVIHINGYAQ